MIGTVILAIAGILLALWVIFKLAETALGRGVLYLLAIAAVIGALVLHS